MPLLLLSIAVFTPKVRRRTGSSSWSGVVDLVLSAFIISMTLAGLAPERAKMSGKAQFNSFSLSAGSRGFGLLKLKGVALTLASVAKLFNVLDAFNGLPLRSITTILYYIKYALHEYNILKKEQDNGIFSTFCRCHTNKGHFDLSLMS